MENKENTKKARQTPEIVDLDLDKTASGPFNPDEIYTSVGPSEKAKTY